MAEESLGYPLKIRPFSLDDLNAILTITNSVTEVDTGQPGQLTLDTLDYSLKLTNPKTECFVAELNENEIIGFCTAQYNKDYAVLEGHGGVHPTYWRRAIGRRLLECIEARGLELSHGKRVVSYRRVRDHQSGLLALLEHSEYEVVQVQAYMEMTFDGWSQEIYSLDGISIQSFNPDTDIEIIYSIHQEAFRPTRLYGGDTLFSEWKEAFLDHPYYDPSLWLVAVANEQIIAISMSFAVSSGKPDVSNLAVLAVLPEWQGKGVGRVLLNHTLSVLQGRGFERVVLIVDSNNRPNAFSLYESVGMRVAWRRHTYKKFITTSI